jgi:hypothetical protein
MSANSSHQNPRPSASGRAGERSLLIPSPAICGLLVCACCLMAIDQMPSAEPVKLVPRAIPGMSPAQINTPKTKPASVVKAPVATVTSDDKARVLSIRRHHQLPDSQKLKKSEPVLILPNEDKNPLPPAAPTLQDGKIRIIPKELVPSLKVQKGEQKKNPTPAK